MPLKHYQGSLVFGGHWRQPPIRCGAFVTNGRQNTYPHMLRSATAAPIAAALLVGCNNITTAVAEAAMLKLRLPARAMLAMSSPNAHGPPLALPFPP